MRVLFFIFLLTSAPVSLLSNSVIAVDPNKGFSMKMMHINSKESPLYVGDHLTRVEKLERLAKQSKAHAVYIESRILRENNATRSMIPDDIRMPAVYEASGLYVAKVGLGTFRGGEQSFMDYYLITDTASDQTWLQCEGATETFNQDTALYPWSLSTTYRPVPCNGHPYCFTDKCNADGQCTYSVSYLSGQVSSGIVATEKFTLGSNTGGVENIELQIGCGFRQENFNIGNNYSKDPPTPDLIAGLLGLGAGQWSFINQLGVAGQGKFSHCFETYHKKLGGSDTYFRFGAAATIGGAFQKVYVTPLVETTFETSLYYLNLEDISVGNNRVRFPTGTFKVKLDGGQRKGGAIIDSGSSVSMLHRDHFDTVVDLVKTHFNEFRVEFIGSQYGFDVCFRLPGRFDTNNYPSITLHFEQADYVIQDYKSNFIIITKEIVCLGIMRGDATNVPALILGAMQQTNKRILYNLNELSLSFAAEYCELDS